MSHALAAAIFGDLRAATAGRRGVSRDSYGPG